MPEQPRPSLGRIVLYRGQDGRDNAAIITDLVGEVERLPEAVTPGDERVHLFVFWSRASRQDYLHPEFGVPRSTKPEAGCWRWPERV